MNQLASSKSSGLWPNCGYGQLSIDGQNQLLVTDAFLTHSIRRPELSPVDTSCQTERVVFEQLCQTPRSSISPETLSRLVNQDMADNFRVWLRFRDRLLASPTLEEVYKGFFQGGGIDFPPVFVDDIAQVLVRHVLGEACDSMQARVGEMFFRSQTVTVHEKGSLMAADSLTLFKRSQVPGYGALGQLLKKGGVTVTQGDLEVLTADNAERYWRSTEAFDMAVVLNWGQPAAKALCWLIEKWVRHLLHAEVTVKTVGAIEDEQWAWHLGLDAQSTAILNDLYQGKPMDDERLLRLLVLFQLKFSDPADMLPKVAGQPVYMAIAADENNRLRIKPQNLLVNLPLALRS
ncbi:MAG: DUF6352 family protein [Burkholderiaceae bacterium]